MKLLAILNMYQKSKRGAECIAQAKCITVIKSPNDGFIRTVLSSPPLFDVLHDSRVGRIRLAFKPDDMLAVYETKLEEF